MDEKIKTEKAEETDIKSAPEENAEKDTAAAETEDKKESNKDTKDNKKDKKADKQLKDDNKKLSAALAEANKKLEETEKKLAESDDKYLRVAAEYDNFRKRSAKEKDEIYSNAYSDSLNVLLPMIDNIERAAQFKESDKVAEGVELMLKTVPDILSKLGVTQVGEVGEKFDPNIHNAVMHIEDEEHGEGEIVAVFQKGYMRGDKVIRFAMVQVAN